MIPVFSPIDLFFAERLGARHALSEEGRLLLSLLMALARQGHVCIDLEKIEDQLRTLCAGDAPLLAHLSSVARRADLPSALLAHVAHPSDFPAKPICRWKSYVYLQKNWVYESEVLAHLHTLSRSAPGLKLSPSPLPSTLNAEQQLAVHTGLQHTLSFITGGPGTGKTYTAAHLVRACLDALAPEEKQKFRVILTAPTGKAVTHLEKNILKTLPESFSLTSGTLHAFLAIRADKEREEEPPVLFADLIIVDESSMIDAALFARLSKAVLEGARLVFLGDPDQLPPIETGSFFADLISSETFPVTQLKQSLRTERGGILRLASAIQSGKFERLQDEAVQRIDLHMNQGKQFISSLIACVADRFLKPTSDEPDLEMLLASNETFRILSCMRQGACGVDAINRSLYAHFVESASEGWLPIPILITRNDYAMQLYNGDTGFLVRHIGELDDYAVFPDRKGGVRRLSACALSSFEYAYCLSVHKSQGSEYDEILLLIPEGSENFGREVLYTAVTRARRRVLFDGSDEVIEKAIQTSSRKISALGARLEIS